MPEINVPDDNVQEHFLRWLQPVLDTAMKDIPKLDSSKFKPLQEQIDALLAPAMKLTMREVNRINSERYREIYNRLGEMQWATDLVIKRVNIQISSSKVADPADSASPQAPLDNLVDEVALDDVWPDIERLLRKDKQLRRSVRSRASQLAPESKVKRKVMERALLVLVWLCLVLGPWTDGELKVDDATNPVGALAAELAAHLSLPHKARKNPLQKNGPRRRRHRRKR